MSHKLHIEWLDERGMYALSVKVKKDGMLMYAEEDMLVVSFSDWSLYAAVDVPASAETLEFFSWYEVRVSLSDIDGIQSLIASLREIKGVRSRLTYKPDGAKIAHYVEPRGPEVLFNATLGLFSIGRDAGEDAKDLHARWRSQKNRS